MITSFALEALKLRRIFEYKAWNSLCSQLPWQPRFDNKQPKTTVRKGDAKIGRGRGRDSWEGWGWGQDGWWWAKIGDVRSQSVTQGHGSRTWELHRNSLAGRGDGGVAGSPLCHATPRHATPRQVSKTSGRDRPHPQSRSNTSKRRVAHRVAPREGNLISRIGVSKAGWRERVRE